MLNLKTVAVYGKGYTHRNCRFGRKHPLSVKEKGQRMAALLPDCQVIFR